MRRDEGKGKLDRPVDEVAHDSCVVVGYKRIARGQNVTSIPNVVMFAPSGRWFGTRARRLGQTAFNI